MLLVPVQRPGATITPTAILSAAYAQQLVLALNDFVPKGAEFFASIIGKLLAYAVEAQYDSSKIELAER